MDFNDIIGHNKIISNMKAVIEKNKLNHSYLFEGPESVGKRKVALTFAKTLLCKKEGIEPCNNCTSCLKFDTENHPDFFIVEPQKNVIRKEQIEDIIKSMITRPYESNRKIYIIDDSYTMTKEAQNSFLKTLEEPPKYVNIILISNNSKNLLSTIVSRCQVIKFFPVQNQKIINFLTSKYDKSEKIADFIASFSKGSVGKAIKLASSENFFQTREKTIQIIDNILKGDKLKVFNSMEFFQQNEENIDQILDIILYWFRDLYIYKRVPQSKLLINRDKLEILSSETFLSISQINDIIEIVKSTKDKLKSRVNFQLSLELMFLNFQEV